MTIQTIKIIIKRKLEKDPENPALLNMLTLTEKDPDLVLSIYNGGLLSTICVYSFV